MNSKTILFTFALIFGFASNIFAQMPLGVQPSLLHNSIMYKMRNSSYARPQFKTSDTANQVTDIYNISWDAKLAAYTDTTEHDSYIDYQADGTPKYEIAVTGSGASKARVIYNDLIKTNYTLPATWPDILMYLATNSLTQRWAGTKWVNTQKDSVFTTDAKGNILEERVQSWNGAKWMDSIQYIGAYTDSADTITIYSFSGANRTPSMKITEYIYKGNNTGALDEVWLGGHWYVKHWIRSTYHENSQGLITSMDQPLYDTVSHTWKSSGHTYYFYDAGNKLTGWNTSYDPLSVYVADSIRIGSWENFVPFDPGNNFPQGYIPQTNELYLGSLDYSGIASVGGGGYLNDTHFEYDNVAKKRVGGVKGTKRYNAARQVTSARVDELVHNTTQQFYPLGIDSFTYYPDGYPKTWLNSYDSSTSSKTHFARGYAFSRVLSSNGLASELITVNYDSAKKTWFSGGWKKAIRYKKGTSGIEYPETGSAIQIYPNPVGSLLNISSTSRPILWIQVLDISGREIKSMPASGLQNKVDVSDLPGGMYMVRVYQDNGVIAKEILK